MTPDETLDHILDSWSEDCNLDYNNPHHEIMRKTKLHAKYLKLMQNAKRMVNEVEADYDRTLKLLCKYYAGQCDLGELKTLQRDQYLGVKIGTDRARTEHATSDDLTLRLMRNKHAYEQIVETTEHIIKELNSRGFGLKAFIDWERRLEPNG